MPHGGGAARGEGTFLRRIFALLAAAALVAVAALPVIASTVVNTTHGTWTAYPGQSTSYSTAVQQPINADGTSNFKSNGKSVIPVKFALSQGTGAFVFESYVDNDPATYPYSFLDWSSATPLTFADITHLSAVYAFTVGDCQAGSMRWTVALDDGGVTRNLDIHYQPGTNGLSTQSCAPGTSGQNLIGSSDDIYVIQEFTGTHPGAFDSSYNTDYADAVAELGSLAVVDVTLIVDSGWADPDGNQSLNPERVALTSATVGVGGSTAYSETFTPQPASALGQTCNLPTDAQIKITKVGGAPSGVVNEPVSIQPNDDNGIFRVVDCKLMYNLATSSLSGVGRYKVEAVINGTAAAGAAFFDLR